MRVSNKSTSKKIGGAITGILRCGEVAELECISPMPVYTAVKGICIAKEFMVADGKDIDIQISKELKDIKGEEVTTFVFKVKAVSNE